MTSLLSMGAVSLYQVPGGLHSCKMSLKNDNKHGHFPRQLLCQETWRAALTAGAMACLSHPFSIQPGRGWAMESLSSPDLGMRC